VRQIGRAATGPETGKQLGQKEEAHKAYDRVAEESKKYSWLRSFRQEAEDLLDITSTKSKQD